MTVFEDSRFVAIDRRTRITSSLFAEIKGDAVTKDPASMNLEEARCGMVRSLDNLKRIVEAAKPILGN